MFLTAINPDFGGMGFAVGFIVFYFVFLFLMLALSVAMYVVQSLSLYQIANRRGIHNPWLAWLPVGNAWLIGSISDHYQYITNGKTRKFRHVMLWLNVSVYAVMIVYYIVVFGAAFSATASAAAAQSEAGVAMAMMGMMGSMLLVFFLLFAVAITFNVFFYICMYDIFKSCKPKNAVLFLILSILINVTQPFFVFACRKADEGMPPKIRAIER